MSLKARSDRAIATATAIAISMLFDIVVAFAALSQVAFIAVAIAIARSYES